MYEKDYIMRMIEAFARMLAAILGFKQKGELDKARALIEEAYDTILKVSSGELKAYDQEQWEQFCSKRSPEELEMLADLLKVEGEILLDTGNTEGADALLFKALQLFRLTDSQSHAYSVTRVDKISQLEQRLSGSGD